MSTGFINVIGEALIVEVSRDKDEEVREKRSGKAARNVSEYLSLTAVSMLINSYLGAYLLNYLSTRQIFAVSALFPVVSLAAGFFVVEKKLQKPKKAK